MSKNRAIIIGAVVSIGFLVLAIFSFFRVSMLEERIENKEANERQITAYFATSHSNRMVNYELLEALEQEVDLSIEGRHLYAIRTPHGFNMISFSSYWNEELLKELYEDLIQIRYGPEMSNIYEIVIGDRGGRGTLSGQRRAIVLSFNLPMFRSEQTFRIHQYMTILAVPIVDWRDQDITTIQGVAWFLNLAYGRHFVYYHFLSGWNTVDEQGREYARIRGFASILDRVIDQGAYDFMQLLGSPATRIPNIYIDINQWLHNQRRPQYWAALNGHPQFSLTVPLAHDVPGLYNFFNSLVSDDFVPREELPELRDLNIRIVRGSSRTNTMRYGVRYHTHHRIYWDDVYREEGAIYTLITFQRGWQWPEPIRTVRAGETTRAFIGEVTRRSPGYYHWNSNDLNQGTRYFVITILFPDGTLRMTEPHRHTFN